MTDAELISAGGRPCYKCGKLTMAAALIGNVMFLPVCSEHNPYMPVGILAAKNSFESEIARLTARIAAQAEAIAVMREALEPFADEFDRREREISLHFSAGSASALETTFDGFRRAHDVLAKLKEIEG